MRKIKTDLKYIIEKVESNLREYLAMEPEVFPLVISGGAARLHRIASNLIRIEIIKLKGYKYEGKME